MRAFLTGVAIGGISWVMFEANKFALKSLWSFNGIAAKMAWEMIKGVALRRQERADDEGGMSTLEPTRIRRYISKAQKEEEMWESIRKMLKKP